MPCCPPDPPPRGSSPRGRGKRGRGDHRRRRVRLIPARAGKTWSVPCHSRFTGGSSPRGRGKRRGPVGRRSTLRLIPARAGKTRCQLDTAPRVRAHPRAGGENIASTGREVNRAGSSPRGRGKPRVDLHGVTPVGLIPARAGKTSCRARSRPSTPAHPRAGGENIPSTTTWWNVVGSSPRGRGKPERRRGRQQGDRLIPARAGKTVVIGLGRLW